MPDGRLRRHGKRPRSALPSDSVTRKSLTTERPERHVVPVFRVTFGLHSVVIQPRGQRPTSAMPRPSTPPAAPSTSLFSFPHPSTPRNVEPFGSTALQTYLNTGISRSAPPHCTRPAALHSARPHRKAANKPQPRFPRSAPPHCIRPVAPPAPEAPLRAAGARRLSPPSLSPLNASASSPLAAPLAPSRGIFAPSTRHLPPRRRGSTPIFGRRRGFSRINSYLCSAGPLCRRRLGRGRKVRATQSATQANHLISVRV